MIINNIKVDNAISNNPSASAPRSRDNNTSYEIPIKRIKTFIINIIIEPYINLFFRKFVTTSSLIYMK